MIFAVAAVICMLASLGLFRGSLGFRVDAAPVGNVLLVGSIMFFLAGVFLLGVSAGTIVGSVVS